MDRDGDQPPIVAGPARLTASVPSPQARLQVWLTTDDDDPVAVTYTDPRGGTRTVRHAALATVELTVRRQGQGGLTLSSRRGAYEYGTREPMPGITPRLLPEG